MTDIIYHFEWDPKKDQENRDKHGIAFADAAAVVQDPLAISIVDNEHDEERWITLGQAQGRLLAVVHTFVEASEIELRIRIISARQATKPERKSYEEDR